MESLLLYFFFSSRRRHTRSTRDWSSDVCSSDLARVRRLLFRTRQRVRRQQHFALDVNRSEERRVGKECRSWWQPNPEKKKKKERGRCTVRQSKKDRYRARSTRTRPTAQRVGAQT